jgi:uncharacterized protein YigE (DUF2233 family)
MAMRIRGALALAGGLLCGSPALSATCETIEDSGLQFAVCTAAAGEDVRTWLLDVEGQPIAGFGRLQELAEAEGRTLVFAMNGGMYHPDRSPVGLFIADGSELSPIVTTAGPGNFGMRPNGVFCVGAGGFAVWESRRFAEEVPECRFATQSGPMLLVGGSLHPRFLPDATSRQIRNGVGVSPDGQTAWFAISDQPVTFHEFATFFRDRLGARDALYLDGSISRLYAPALGRNDAGFPMGPILGLVAPKE